MQLEPWQWGCAAAAAFFVGISKTGVPGMGILVVPFLAAVFGGRASVGIMLPMLIFADCFAVLWYRRHAQWDKLIGLFPWVAAGMAFGAGALWAVGEIKGDKDVLNIVIGVIVLAMLAIYILQNLFGERLSPKSKAGVISTGAAAGFATTVSNAAGSIMSVYMMAQELPKNEFMGTIAWYFFIINLSKLPIYFVLTAINPAKPIITMHSLGFVLMTTPAILAGVFIGKWLLPRIPQRLFETVVLFLAAVSAIKLMW